MNMLFKMSEMIEKCRGAHEEFMSSVSGYDREAVNVKGISCFKSSAVFGEFERDFEKSLRKSEVVLGDNLEYMKHLLAREGMAGSIQFTYIDPPFYSKNSYAARIRVAGENIKLPAYDDKWCGGMESYLEMLCERLFLMRELVSDTGYVCIHLDWHVVHYAKVMMDAIFGEEYFVNEIIWTYKSGGSTKRFFSRKHDTLLLYRKTDKNYFKAQTQKSYNRELRPYNFESVKEYRDEKGWYTLVNMKDVWEIDMVGRTSGERTGYATQKPENLIRRLLESCSRPGDICADFFGGSGVLAKVAADMKRDFISCDNAGLSVVIQMLRLLRAGAVFKFIDNRCIKNNSAADRRGELNVRFGCDKKEFTKHSIDTALEKSGQGSKTSISAERNLPLTVRLTGYRPDISGSVMSKAYKKFINSVDPVEMLAFWSVDPAYDGDVHRSGEVRMINDGRVEREINFGSGEEKCGIISILAADVFGVITQKVIYTEDFK